MPAVRSYSEALADIYAASGLPTRRSPPKRHSPPTHVTQALREAVSDYVAQPRSPPRTEVSARRSAERGAASSTLNTTMNSDAQRVSQSLAVRPPPSDPTSLDFLIKVWMEMGFGFHGASFMCRS